MKKSFGILLSAALLLTFCVSGNLAVSAAETETVVETEQQDAALKEDDSQEEQNENDMISEEQDTEEQDTQEQDTEESVKDDSDSETELDDENVSDGQTDVESDTETTDNETNDTESDEIDMTETETDTATDTESSEVETDEVSDTEVSDSETDEEESSAQEEDALTAHIETCSDDCQDENCLCSCHLFERLIACETLEEVWKILDAISEEASTLTDEQVQQIEEKISARYSPTPVPVEEGAVDEIVPSEIVHPTVNFTRVAPIQR